LTILVGWRVLLGLCATPDAARAIFDVAGLVDNGSEGDGVDEVTFRTTVANTVEVIVSTVADNTTRTLQSTGLEDEVTGDLVGGSVGVGRSDSEHFTSREGFVENVFDIGPSVVDVDVMSLSVIELGVDELASGALVAARGGVLGIKVGAELEILDLGVGRIVQRWHGENVFMGNCVESDIVEGIDFSVSGRIAVGCVSSSVFLGIVIVVVVNVVIIFVIVVVVLLALSLIVIVVTLITVIVITSLMMMIVIIIVVIIIHHR
jgi:hypothetical protein